MKVRITLLSLMVLLLSTSAGADIVYLNDGSTIEGVIKKVAAGQVVIQVGEETKTFDILAVESMDFTTAHLVDVKNVDAEEIVSNIQQLEKTSAEIDKLLMQIKTFWMLQEPIAAEKTGSWEAAKETFRKPLNKYQELLNDLYFHVLAKVDKYNLLMKDAGEVYVGVKGPFNVGSPLVAKEARELPLTKYVPAAWYDTIFYDGYNVGYDDAYMKFAPYKGSN